MKSNYFRATRSPERTKAESGAVIETKKVLKKPHCTENVKSEGRVQFWAPRQVRELNSSIKS